jgi:hypothetical protein
MAHAMIFNRTQRRNACRRHCRDDERLRHVRRQR